MTICGQALRKGNESIKDKQLHEFFWIMSTRHAQPQESSRPWTTCKNLYKANKRKVHTSTTEYRNTGRWKGGPVKSERRQHSVSTTSRTEVAPDTGKKNPKECEATGKERRRRCHRYTTCIEKTLERQLSLTTMKLVARKCHLRGSADLGTHIYMRNAVHGQSS